MAQQDWHIRPQVFDTLCQVGVRMIFDLEHFLFLRIEIFTA